jgi:hypothetical protein
MQRADKGTEVLLLDELDLVDEEDDADAFVPRSATELEK